MMIPVRTSQSTYDIALERGALYKINEYLNINRKVLIVTDSGVPKAYSQAVCTQCKDYCLYTFEQGEKSKNINTLTEILAALVDNGFTRTDCVVAVGGGVVGDMAGFAAAVYMRGIDFYNIPTTLLSQVDSSIGGKTAIDFMGLKNIVGAFYPPKRVVIDPNTLKTLPDRQISNGLAEALKMSLTSDKCLFELFENTHEISDGFLDTVIEKSLLIKKHVVEEDEKESGLRKILNFGHTLAHAMEAEDEMNNIYHGEAVALGMLPMCSDEVRNRLLPVLCRLKLPTELNFNPEKLIEACRHDKKKDGSSITAVYVNAVGEFELKKIPFSELEALIYTAFKKEGGL